MVFHEVAIRITHMAVGRQPHLVPLGGLLHVGLLVCAHEMSGEFLKNE